MKATILKKLTEEDWMFCKRCALETIGLDPKAPPNEEWKQKILRARHSPIRDAVAEANPEFVDEMVPMCMREGECMRCTRAEVADEAY